MTRARVVRVDVDHELYDDVLELDRLADLGSAPSAHTQWWAAVADDRVVGYAGAVEVFPGTPAHAFFLSRAGVVKEYRGRRIQRALIRARLRCAAELGFAEAVTYTSPDNVASMRSLMACGFKPYLPRPGQYWAGWGFVHWKAATAGASPRSRDLESTTPAPR